jgi:hypothetical protein
MKQITPEFAFTASFTPFKYLTPATEKGKVVKDKDGKTMYEVAETSRFIKPGETQVAALKRLRNSSLGRTKANNSTRIPFFKPGITTTMQYVAEFERINFLKHSGSAMHLNNRAPAQLDDSVQFEDLSLETCEDLV